MKLNLKLLLAVTLSAIVIIACNKGQKTSEPKAGAIIHSSTSSPNTIKPLHSPGLKKIIGKIFPADTGWTWTSNYLQLHPSFGNNKPCIFRASDLAVLHKPDNCIGISFSNVNFTEGWGLLAYVVDATGSIIKADSVLSSFGNISWLKADSLKQAYIFNNPSGAIYSEFFGSDIFNQLFYTHGFESVLVNKGYNANGECIILSDAYNKNNVVGEDAFSCPPLCPKPVE
ncbi:MAG TPA: hypothetical protein VGO09_11625 [Flavisolibacter sp.]|nr:hypothetical protein [Flavisolibacter sp.]